MIPVLYILRFYVRIVIKIEDLSEKFRKCKTCSNAWNVEAIRRDTKFAETCKRVVNLKMNFGITNSKKYISISIIMGKYTEFRASRICSLY